MRNILIAGLALFLLCSNSPAANLQFASEPDSALQESASLGHFTNPQISGDGQFMLFNSSARNLAAGAADGAVNLYLYSFSNHSITLVSSASNSTPAAVVAGSGHSLVGAATPDGRFVAFQSLATNMVPYDTKKGGNDVYLRDTALPTNQLVSITLTRTSGSGSNPVLTPDGRFVAFESLSRSLTTNDTVTLSKIFLRDMKSGKTELISLPGPGFQTASCSDAQISDDGRLVAFIGNGRNLAKSSTISSAEIYVRNRATAKTLWASTNAISILTTNTTSSGTISVEAPAMTLDGNFVFFKATYSSHSMILRYDTQTQTTKKIDLAQTGSSSSNPGGVVITPDGKFALYIDASSPSRLVRWSAADDSKTPINVDSGGNIVAGSWKFASLSGDGRYVSFAGAPTLATSFLLPGITNWQVYLRDVAAGTTKLVSKLADGSPSGASETAEPQISSDGSRIIYDSLDLRSQNPFISIFINDLASDSTIQFPPSADLLKSSTAQGVIVSAALSGSGTRLAFGTTARLIAQDTDTAQDIYSRDLATGALQLISLRGSGTSQDGFAAQSPVVSSNGNVIAFASRSANFIENDTNNFDDVFVRDLSAAGLVCASVGMDGQVASGPSRNPRLSADGRFIVFESKAALATNDLNTQWDVYMRDLKLGTTIEISVNSSGVSNGGDSTNAVVSPDGRFVAFLGASSSITTPPASGTQPYLYLRDTASNRTIFLASSATAAKLEFSPDSSMLVYPKSGGLWLMNLADQTTFQFCSNCSDAHSSAQANYIVYRAANNLLLYYREANENLSLTYDLVTLPLNYRTKSSAISSSGKFIVYSSFSNDRSNDRNYLSDIRLIDFAGTRKILSAGSNQNSAIPMISADGKIVLFASLASDLGEADFNGAADLFIYRNEFSDSDGDGLDDSWELTFFGDLSQNGAGDLDGDGFSNRDEYLAGTDPTNNDSYFSVILGQSVLTGAYVITFAATPGSNYHLEIKPDLNSPWTKLGESISAKGRSITITDPDLSPSKFYRAVLEAQ